MVAVQPARYADFQQGGTHAPETGGPVVEIKRYFGALCDVFPALLFTIPGWKVLKTDKGKFDLDGFSYFLEQFFILCPNMHAENVVAVGYQLQRLFQQGCRQGPFQCARRSAGYTAGCLDTDDPETRPSAV